MGTLLENLKEKYQPIIEFFQDVGEALNEIFSIEEESNDIDQAIVETRNENLVNKEELAKICDAIMFQQQKGEEQWEERFGIESGNTKDGYNEIPDKVTENIKAKVSEQEALKGGNNRKNRKKGGREKTRVDED